MQKPANFFFISLLCILCLQFISTDARRVIRAAPEVPKTGNFVVKLDQSISHEDFVRVEKEIVNNGEGSPVLELENDLIKVVTIRINESMLEEVKHLKGVEYLEEETYAHGTGHIPFHLDRVDEDCTHSTLDDSFQPIATGEGVDIYILDSGIHYSHDEFDGRAKYAGKDPIDNYDGTSQSGLDCHGHGTHCASLAAGKSVGIAKEATVHSVRVLACDNFGPWSAIISGLNHVVTVAKQTNRPSIISMSLGGPFFRTVDNLVTSVVKDSGIPVIVAAGNDRKDACSETPASNSLAITVGASKEGRQMYYYSNGGSCVDIIAPGQNIKGAARTCNTCFTYLTGTSMATPIVAGAAAIHLQRMPKLSPSALKKILVDDACTDKLDFTDLGSSLKSTTPNKLLHIQGGCGGIFRVSATESKEVTSPNYGGQYPNDIECVYKLVTDRGRLVRLTMNTFKTHDFTDFLEIIDGYYVESKFMLASLNITMPSQKVYQSTVNALTLRFKTNPDESSDGFKATFDSIDDVSSPSSSVTTVTSTVTSTNTRTNTVTLINTVTSTSVATTTQTQTTTDTQTLISTQTQTQTVSSTKTETQTETETQVQTETETKTQISATTTTIMATTTVTRPSSTAPTPIRLMPSGTPLEEMCCEVLNNVDYMSFTMLEGVSRVMEKGMQYISKLVDKNASFVIDEPIDKQQPSTTMEATQITPSRTISPIVRTSPNDNNHITSIANVNSISQPEPTQVPDNTQSNPADSCEQLSGQPSGEYWVKSNNGSAIRVFCELKVTEYKGMAQIVHVNYSSNGVSCPEELKTVNVQNSKKTLCGRKTPTLGCSSVHFSTKGIKYSKVCGRIIGYQHGSPNGFYWYDKNRHFTINDIYVDGVILTYTNATNNQRQHIWTFAAALDEMDRQNLNFACECTNTGSSPVLPSFVQNNYFCETGSRELFQYDRMYLDDPLWDGKGCGDKSSCCNNNGIFCTELPESTTASIELSICANENLTNEDTPLEFVELYVN